MIQSRAELGIKKGEEKKTVSFLRRAAFRPEGAPSPNSCDLSYIM